MKLSRCLHDLGITDASIFEECDDVNDEFKVIRKIYLKKALLEHPDKGGDPETFRTTQVSWEVLRDLFDRNKVQKGSFTSYLGAKTYPARSRQANDAAAADDDDDDDDDEDYDDELYEKYSKDTSSYPSYQYYEDAEKEEVPTYKVEPARSDRSKCQKCKTNIPKMGVRIGSIDKDAGTYGRWIHLDCWRVPMKIQHGLTNPRDIQTSLRDLMAMEEVLLTGVRALDTASQLLFVQRCVNPEHWAGSTKRKAALMAGESVASSDQGSSKSAKSSTTAKSTTAAAAAAAAATSDSAKASATSEASTAGPAAVPSATNSATTTSTSAGSSNATTAPVTFHILVPGVNGALDANFLRGLTFVITGTFPEAGGGGESDAGVAYVTAMIQSFGGKVNGRFSKKTNFLLTGMKPNKIKFFDAATRSVAVVSLRRLQYLLLGIVSLEQLATMPSMTFDEFCANYQYARPASSNLPPGQNVGAPPAVQQPSTAPAAPPPNPPETKPKPPKSKPKPKSENAPVDATATAATTEAITSTSLVPSTQNNHPSTAVVSHTGKRGKFIIPRPGVNGAVAGVLSNKRFVLTGVFPEVGGGSGLVLGKDRTKEMIESFGGRVTSSVSGKTDFVVVGQEPGRSKVTQAEDRNIPLLDLLSLHRLLMGQQTIAAAASAPPPRITNFSAGYAGQGRIGYY